MPRGKEYYEKVKAYTAKMDRALRKPVPAGGMRSVHEIGTYSDLDAAVNKRIRRINRALEVCPKKTRDYVNQLLKDNLDRELITKIAKWERNNQIAYNTCDEEDKPYFKKHLDSVQVDEAGNFSLGEGVKEEYREALGKMDFILDVAEHLSCAKKLGIDDDVYYENYFRRGNLPYNKEYAGDDGKGGKMAKYGIQVPDEVMKATNSYFHFPDKIEIDFENMGSELNSDALYTRENIESGSLKTAAVSLMKIKHQNKEEVQAALDKHQKQFERSVEDSVWETLEPALCCSPNIGLTGKLVLINGIMLNDFLERQYKKEHPQPADNSPEMDAWLANFPGNPVAFRKLAADAIASSLHDGINVDIIPTYTAKDGEPIIDPKPRPITAKGMKARTAPEFGFWKSLCHKVLGWYKDEYEANERNKAYEYNKLKSISRVIVEDRSYTLLDFNDKELQPYRSQYKRDDFKQSLKDSIKDRPNENKEVMKDIVDLATKAFEKRGKDLNSPEETAPEKPLQAEGGVPVL